MPVLAGLFLAIFTEIAAFFANYVGKKLALGGAAVATFGVMTLALYGTLALLLNGLAFAMPSWPGLSLSIWVAIPPAVPSGVAAVIAADSAIALYQWNIRNMQLMAYIT